MASSSRSCAFPLHAPCCSAPCGDPRRARGAFAEVWIVLAHTRRRISTPPLKRDQTETHADPLIGGGMLGRDDAPQDESSSQNNASTMSSARLDWEDGAGEATGLLTTRLRNVQVHGVGALDMSSRERSHGHEWAPCSERGMPVDSQTRASDTPPNSARERQRELRFNTPVHPGHRKIDSITRQLILRYWTAVGSPD